VVITRSAVIDIKKGKGKISPYQFIAFDEILGE